METETADKSVPRESAAPLSSERLILRETKRAVTPFGGVAVFVSFLRKIDLVGELRRHMPIQWKSPNQIDPTVTFAASLMTVLVGAQRFAQPRPQTDRCAGLPLPGVRDQLRGIGARAVVAPDLLRNTDCELKHDLGADGFCLKEFFATEAAFRAVPAPVQPIG